MARDFIANDLEEIARHCSLLLPFVGCEMTSRGHLVRRRKEIRSDIPNKIERLVRAPLNGELR